MLIFTNMGLAGMLPMFFDERDVRPAREQLHENYAHGGGVQPFEGFELFDAATPHTAYLQYPEDPPMRELSRAKLRDETIILFEHDWVAITQFDGSYLITRCD